ncbi:helicase ARIP4-like isoform X1 [Polyodon spathula]|uniref:helicase ARIP4-like isoform X1 n=1 Tax=Polyodon spathula TaxID=7913 RepID=UPI001B7E3443|nr:helicase ARIP4-like isoform X1 [Polyodon spathula]
MSEEASSGSDADLDLDPNLGGEEEEEEEMEEDDNDGDDEEDVNDKSDQPQTSPCSTEQDPQSDGTGWQSTTPTISQQGELPVPSKSTPAHSAKKKKRAAQKPPHMRRNIRKLLREHQLEAVTKAAQQEEAERRKRLDQQRKDYPVPDCIQGEVVPRTDEVSQRTPHATKQDVICLDSSNSSGSASEDDTKRMLHSIRDDVIELSSGDEETLQISSESTNEEEEEGGAGGSEESSGAHINDALNRPDTQGRVLVNINHPSGEKDLYLAPQLARAVKPHQIGGIRFLYDNLVESLERFETSSGFGCILAHSMGLGKTLQVISFVDVLLRHTAARTVLAIVPVNTLQNWLAEFNMWLPAQEALPQDYNPEEILPRTCKVHILNDEHKTTAARAKVISDWSTGGGVLLMGYEMYRLLSLKKSFVTGRKKKPKKPAGPVIIDLDEEDRQQELLKGMEKALSRPGPDVVICDEGHRIKNCHASTSQALKSIHTRRRVVLTGYPLQNNLIEYWCMVDFVRPDFLGTRQEFSNMFERPILNGQCMDSTPQDRRLMRYRSHVLHSLLEGFVQRRGHDVLQNHLPSKEEHVIMVRLSPIQRALYTEFMDRFREAGNSGWLGLNPLKAFCVCCKIWNHPDILYEVLQKQNLANEQDLDLDDITTSNNRCHPQGIKPKPEPSAAAGTDASNSKYNLGAISLGAMQEKANQVLTYEWAKDIMTDYQTGLLENSAKMVLLFHLIKESVSQGDKVLVFSQSLSTLSVIEAFLAKRPMPDSLGTEGQGCNWVRNVNYYRLDGSTSTSERERLINQFNDPQNDKAWLFLLSTRAGCLGVNLVGANRVVVFDASWNPCHDAQAVCRVYRYGQKKPCHIYRLVSDYTLEKKIYDRQISKQGMSDRVVDDLNPVMNFTRREVESLLHFVEEEPASAKVHLEPSEHLERILHGAYTLYPHLITKQPFQHESLLVDRKEQKLTKAEKKAAKKSYEDEKRASVPYTRPSYAHYYPASDQSLTNIPAFSQRNWRPPPRLDEKPVASVRPVQSTPIPMMPRQVPMGASSSIAGTSSALNFPVNFLQQAGVLVQKIVTTTDIVIPGTNSSTDVQARISAGESIHVIRGTKGTYIRTSDGRIFAVRAARKSRQGQENSDTSSGSQRPALESTSNGSNGSASPDSKRKRLTPDSLTRPLSPDSPEIISELQQYAALAAVRETGDKPALTTETQGGSSGSSSAQGVSAEQLLMMHGLKPGPSLSTPASSQPAESSSSGRNSRGEGGGAEALDLQGSKRKWSSPACDEQSVSKQQQTSKRTSVPRQGYPLTGGYNLPPMGLNPALTNPFLAQMGHPMYMGPGSPYFQAHGQMGDPRLMFADPFSLGGASAPSSSSSSAAASASMSPFMLSPSLGGMLPGFPLPYGQSLMPEPRMYAPYPSSHLLPGGLPATPGPAGSGYLPGFPPQTDPQILSESDSSCSDDDVIEVMGQ